MHRRKQVHSPKRESRQLLAATAASIGLAGCYPALKVVQPQTDLTVRDADGSAIDGARVTLATYRYPFPSAASTTMATYQTGSSGDLSLRARRKWQWQVLLPDGTTWYSWAYCIEKTGYRAVASVEPDFRERITVVLERSVRPSTCEWPTAEEPYYQIHVVEQSD